MDLPSVLAGSGIDSGGVSVRVFTKDPYLRHELQQGTFGAGEVCLENVGEHKS